MPTYRELRKALRPLKRAAKLAKTRLIELPWLFRNPPFGSAEWLIRQEIRYGGLIDLVPRSVVSPNDSRPPEQLNFGGMTGGDRMLHHGYAPIYAKHLAGFLEDDEVTLGEFGILKGTGLAIWCDLLPRGRVLGFDIDLGHFQSHRPELERRGAFAQNRPELFTFDQLEDTSASLTPHLKGEKIAIAIDDGLHSLPSILQTWRAVKPHLADRFVYFIEDYPNLLSECGDEFIGCKTEHDGNMTVIFSP